MEDEVIEAQSKVLEDLDMKLNLCLVSLLCGLFDLKSDILDYWVDDLA